jgi:hypothetical protein
MGERVKSIGEPTRLLNRLVQCTIKLHRLRRPICDALVANRYSGRIREMLDHEQNNQTQPHEQQAECDAGDRYAEQNAHDRVPLL